MNDIKSRNQKLRFNGYTHKSVAVWPEGTTKDVYGNHRSKYEAEMICRRLKKEGFGGQGKIFPIETRVEEIKC